MQIKIADRTMRIVTCALASAALSFGIAKAGIGAENPSDFSGKESMHFKSWRDLIDADRTPSTDVRYFELKLDNGSKAYLCVVDLKGKRVCLKPYVNTPGCASSNSLAMANGFVAVNGGYFNLSNGESTSYVVVDGKVVCDPHANPALMTNLKLAPYIEKIMDRSEIRVEQKAGKRIVEINKHSAPPCHGATIIHSLQAGPRLLPEAAERDEAFVRKEPGGKEIDSIGSYKQAARTALGITDDGHALILCVAGNKQDEFSSGASLAEVAALLKKLGCTSAINFDGGTSTTMVVMLDNGTGGFFPKTVCGRDPETHVKSVLLVEPYAER